MTSGYGLSLNIPALVSEQDIPRQVTGSALSVLLKGQYSYVALLVFIRSIFV